MEGGRGSARAAWAVGELSPARPVKCLQANSDEENNQETEATLATNLRTATVDGTSSNATDEWMQSADALMETNANGTQRSEHTLC